MINWFRNFMYGRYGGDQLGMALLVGYFIFMMLETFTGLGILSWFGLALALYSLWRMLSRDLDRRRKENFWFVSKWNPIRDRFRSTFFRAKDSRKNLYFRCSGCSNTLRVPRGRGKIEVTCPKCGKKTIKKS